MAPTGPNRAQDSLAAAANTTGDPSPPPQQPQAPPRTEKTAIMAGHGFGVMWTKDTDLVLRDLVLRSGCVDWAEIAAAIEWDAGSVAPKECYERWEEVKETPVKGPWSSEEDAHLKRLVEDYGAKKWNLLARAFPGRSGKQCRERFHNHVDERVKKGEWTAEEDQILCEAQRQLGNKWSEMSRILEGRSENAIKNRFNSLNAKGLTETRANELVSKLDPQDAQEFLLRPPPLSAAATTTTAARRHSPQQEQEQDQEQEQEQEQDQDQDSPQSPLQEEDEYSNNNSNDSVEDHIDGENSDDAITVNDESCYAASHAGELQEVIGVSYEMEGRGEDQRAGGGGGGSSALRALMVAVKEERKACIGNPMDSDEESGHCWGGRTASEAGHAGGGTERLSMRDESESREKKSTGRKAGMKKLRTGDPTSSRGMKRERNAAVDANKRQQKRGSVRRKSEMVKADAGISVLAQAAGLLDIEDDAEQPEDDDGHVSSTIGYAVGNGSMSRNKDDNNKRLGCDAPYANGGASLGVHPESRYAFHHTRNPTAGPAATTVDYRQPYITHDHHNQNQPRGVGGPTIDHGSTPPGSASPLPGGEMSGGATAGDDAHSCNGGGYRGRGGKGNDVASAFAVGAVDTVCTNTSGIGSSSSYSAYYDGRGRGGVGGGGGDGGSRNSFGEGGGGGGRLRPEWTPAVPGPPDSSALPSRSRWFVGPGGAHRRSLESVPGPWRPYWRGEDTMELEDRGEAAVRFSTKRFEQEEA